MDFFIEIIVVLATFIFMEGVAWFAHKYVMHGFLWSLHEDHHFPKYVKRSSFFEKNDWFFVIFAFPAMICYMLGSIMNNSIVLSVAIGITLYGFAYFIFHEIVFHRRLKWFNRWKSVYVKSIILAHSKHHQHYDRHQGECFGLLIFPYKYLKQEKDKKKMNK